MAFEITKQYIKNVKCEITTNSINNRNVINHKIDSQTSKSDNFNTLIHSYIHP